MRIIEYIHEIYCVYRHKFIMSTDTKNFMYIDIKEKKLT